MLGPEGVISTLEKERLMSWPCHSGERDRLLESHRLICGAVHLQPGSPESACRLRNVESAVFMEQAIFNYIEVEREMDAQPLVQDVHRPCFPPSCDLGITMPARGANGCPSAHGGNRWGLVREAERHPAAAGMADEAEGSWDGGVEQSCGERADHEAKVVELLGIRISREAIESGKVAICIHAGAADRDRDGSESGASEALSEERQEGVILEALEAVVQQHCWLPGIMRRGADIDENVTECTREGMMRERRRGHAAKIPAKQDR